MKITDRAEHAEVIAPLVRQAFDASSEALAIYTAEPWVIACTIVYANEALALLSGFAREHLVGHSALLLAGARPDSTTMAGILPRDEASELPVRARKQRPDGSVYDVDVMVTPMHDTEGRVTHYLARQRQVDCRTSPPPHVDESGVFPRTSAVDDVAKKAGSSRE